MALRNTSRASQRLATALKRLNAARVDLIRVAQDFPDIRAEFELNKIEKTYLHPAATLVAQAEQITKGRES